MKNETEEAFIKSTTFSPLAESIFESIMYSLPVAIIMAIWISGDMWAKKGLYWDGYWVAFGIILLISITLLSIPITIALHNNKKYKGWIIVLTMLACLPFGILFYLVSLAWAIFAPTQMEKKEK